MIALAVLCVLLAVLALGAMAAALRLAYLDARANAQAAYARKRAELDEMTQPGGIGGLL